MLNYGWHVNVPEMFPISLPLHGNVSEVEKTPPSPSGQSHQSVLPVQEQFVHDSVYEVAMLPEVDSRSHWFGRQAAVSHVVPQHPGQITPVHGSLVPTHVNVPEMFPISLPLHGNVSEVEKTPPSPSGQSHRSVLPVQEQFVHDSVYEVVSKPHWPGPQAAVAHVVPSGPGQVTSAHGSVPTHRPPIHTSFTVLQLLSLQVSGVLPPGLLSTTPSQSSSSPLQTSALGCWV
jgi:hypothetical protein